MDKIEETYLQLLRQAVFGGSRGVEEERSRVSCEEWQAVMALAERQGTGALVANEVLKGSRGVEEEGSRVDEGCRGVEEERSRVRLQMVCAQAMMGQER